MTLGIIQSIIISNTAFTKTYAKLAAVGQRSEHGNGELIDLPNHAVTTRRAITASAFLFAMIDGGT